MKSIFLAISLFLLKGFSIDITEMDPMSYPSKAVSGDGYNITFTGDSVAFYLPYVGEARTADLNYDGLNMCKPIYKVSWKEGKESKEVSFRCRRDMIEYQFNITLYDGGRAYIFLQPSNAQSISYTGDWE